MSVAMKDQALIRLTRAEQRGLRLAVLCRTFAIAAALAWYLGAAIFVPEYEPRLWGVGALALYTLVGVIHLFVIGSALDRPWLKYFVYTIDLIGICAAFVLIPVSRADDVPQIIAFRAYGIYYLFPVVAMACLSLSWGLVLWSGIVACLGWWLAFFVVVAPMERTLSWGDIPADATKADYESIFLSIDFIGRGNRIEETGLLFVACAVLAVAVYRARLVFFAQIEAEAQRERERAAREKVTGILGRYVPEQIANRLLEDPDALAPQVRHASALVLDIADFTSFTAGRSPQDVIAALDQFLSGATDVVSAESGVVISFTGDGLLATFNTPVEEAHPEIAAVQASINLIDYARRSQFAVRIGVASGEIASGNIGSSQRQSFTVYGETVNRAARLENLCKQVGVPLLVDSATESKLGEAFRAQAIGQRSIRGLRSQIQVYRIDPPPSQD